MPEGWGNPLSMCGSRPQVGGGRFQRAPSPRELRLNHSTVRRFARARSLDALLVKAVNRHSIRRPLEERAGRIARGGPQDGQEVPGPGGSSRDQPRWPPMSKADWSTIIPMPTHTSPVTSNFSLTHLSMGELESARPFVPWCGSVQATRAARAA